MSPRQLTGTLLASPLLLLLLLAFVAPVLLMVPLSLHPYEPGTGISAGWTLANYTSIVTDEYFREVVVRTLVLGFGVTAICPSAVDTPILDKGAVGRFHGRDYFLKGQGVRRPLDPDLLALQVLDAVAENRPLLVTPRTARIAWRIGRLSPAFVASSSIRFVAKQRRLQAKRAARAR